MVKALIVLILFALIIIAVIFAVMKISVNDNEFNELKKRVNEKQAYYKDSDVMQELISQNEYTVKNNRIRFLANCISLTDTSNAYKTVDIPYKDIIEVKKEYYGNMYEGFVGDKVWDGYGITIVYTDNNKIARKTIYLKKQSKTMHDIVESVGISTVSNIIIGKVQDICHECQG